MKERAERQLFIAPTNVLRGEPAVPSSKYYTLRYILAATLAEGESRVHFPAASDDSDALFRGCRALGATLLWEDEHTLFVQGVGQPHISEPMTINVGNAGAVSRLLMGVSAVLPDVTFVTDHPQSLGKRPNRELLEALTALGVICESEHSEGYFPVTLRGEGIHGGHVTISCARSSQYLSALLFLAPLLDEGLEITVVDDMKSQSLVRASLEVLAEAGVVITYDDTLRHFSITSDQRYLPHEYTVPGDYPSAATLLAACAVMPTSDSEFRLSRLRPGDEIGEAVLAAFRDMGADLRREGDTFIIRGGQRLHGIRVDGDRMIDCIPVMVAAACFVEGESVFYNIESLHYKESDRIDDLCHELQRAGCDVTPQRDSIVVRGRPQGIEGGVIVDGHSDHRVLMALSIAGMRSRQGLTLTGVEHIAKSYPYFFEELRRLSVGV